MAEMLEGGVIMDVVTSEQAKIAEDAGDVDPLQRAGSTVVVIERGARPLGLVAVRDDLRPEAGGVVRDLHAMGLRALRLSCSGLCGNARGRRRGRRRSGRPTRAGAARR